ncbi:MDR family MFS transporter [Kitasatospora sp. NBC_00315]|uniref:MDR family MFS transporter n=1 Tax=Kitasatospora sp. NBC_00315 TaxID=2975963 RepID=UPI003249C3F1
MSQQPPQLGVDPAPATGAPDPAPPTPPDRIPRSLLLLGATVTLGVVMSTLDTTIVTVGVHTMGQDLKTSLSTIQWVTTSYLLAFSLVIPLSGWAVSRFGARRAWLVSLGVFVLGSALCGLAWDPASLIAFRALQGLGGGMLMPLAQTMLARAAGPLLMGRVMGMAAVPGMLSPVFGPVIGGLIVDHLDWPWLFYVNLPLGAVAFVLALRILPRDEPQQAAPLDVVSLLLLSPGLAALVYGFSEMGQAGGLASPVVHASLALGVVMLAGFVVHALRRQKPPLVDLRLFRAPSFVASTTAAFMLGASLFGALILFPLYYQLVRGQDAMMAGLLLAPQGLGAVLVTPYAGKLTDRLGPGRVVPAGLALVLLGTVPYAFVGEATPEPWLAVTLLVRGVGLGLTFVPTLVAAYHGLEPSRIPHATSMVNIAQRVGGSLGTALLSVILQQGYRNRAGEHSSLDAVRSVPTGVHDVVPAFDHAFLWALGFSLVGLVPALLLPRKKKEAVGRP